jgi:GH18 family chitinase
LKQKKKKTRIRFALKGVDWNNCAHLNHVFLSLKHSRVAKKTRTKGKKKKKKSAKPWVQLSLQVAAFFKISPPPLTKVIRKV